MVPSAGNGVGTTLGQDSQTVMVGGRSLMDFENENLAVEQKTVQPD